VNDVVNVEGDGRGGRFVFVVAGIGSLFGNLDQGQENSVVGLGSERVKVKMTEKATLGSKGNRTGLCTTAAPKDSFVVVGEVEIIVAPVDLGIDVGQPGLAEDEMVVVEGVDESIEFVVVIVPSDGESGGVGGDGRRTVGEDDWDWWTVDARERMFFDKGRTDHVSLCTTVNQNTSRVTSHITDKG